MDPGRGENSSVPGKQSWSLNQRGLSAGTTGDYHGTPKAWRGTTSLGTLPLPVGTTTAHVDLIADDDTIFGRSE
ncbi:hypothetical protein M8C13_31120 [Crossiella sp. SN42]|uniref:hypothetical protein n=1 Tax=Crossiella sp. SN42 TaxID=2944808 RepID=UPI00207D0382|nr:hypothetical protein [Crossiella sp. SN42]MCO1580216.1 hypothetical protein [Crossiella sp. SN42]